MRGFPVSHACFHTGPSSHLIDPSPSSPANGSLEFVTRRGIRKMLSLKTASQIEQYRWGLPQMIVALRTFLSGGLEDPQYTEAGQANIKNFLCAASRL
jgi:hypothetical protein